MSRLRQGMLDSVAATRTSAREDLARAVPSPIRTRLLKTVVGFGVLLVVTCVVAPLVGSSPISLDRVFDRSIPFSENVDAQIFFIARMPRIVAGALVGAALAAAGVVFQALLRNALATPFTLGVLRGAWGWTLLVIVWFLALTGIVVKALPRTRHSWISMVLYLVMGWLAIVAIKPIWQLVPMPGILLILAGGLAYTGGLAFFAARGLRYSHFIWHLFVIAGTTFHFFAVLWYAA